jgi:formylmethanofuran dehydrogenase subunit D
MAPPPPDSDPCDIFAFVEACASMDCPTYNVEIITHFVLPPNVTPPTGYFSVESCLQIAYNYASFGQLTNFTHQHSTLQVTAQTNGYLHVATSYTYDALPVDATTKLLIGWKRVGTVARVNYENVGPEYPDEIYIANVTICFHPVCTTPEINNICSYTIGAWRTAPGAPWPDMVCNPGTVGLPSYQSVFSTIYPAGFYIGSPGNSLTLTTPATVQAFMQAQTGVGTCIVGDQVDTVTDYGNLVNQVVALKLNVDYSQYQKLNCPSLNMDFSYGELVYVSTTHDSPMDGIIFSGKTVNQILTMMILAVFDCSLTNGQRGVYTNMATYLNEAFDECVPRCPNSFAAP